MTSEDVQYTHGYRNPALSGLSGRTVQKHAYWLLPHLKPGDRILDAGPGPGTITLGLADAVEPGFVTGVEIGQPYVDYAQEIARSNGVDNVEFLQGNALHLNYDDATFDVVFSFAVLEHIPDPSEALAEWHRVLKPGGLIAVGSSAVSQHAYPAGSPLGAEQFAFYLKIWEMNGGHPELGLSQPELVVAAGFDNVSVGGFFDENDAPKQAQTWPERFRDPELIARAVDLGLATESEILETADEIEKWGVRPDAWYLRAWFWALGRKPA